MAFWVVGIKAVHMACINDDSALLHFGLYSFIWYVNLRVKYETSFNSILFCLLSSVILYASFENETCFTAFDVEDWGIIFCFCHSSLLCYCLKKTSKMTNLFLFAGEFARVGAG